MKIKSYTRGLLVASGLILAPCAAQGQGLVDGLLNYWSFDDETANDTASGIAGTSGTSDDDGVVNGTVTFVDGQAIGFGKAASFPGGTGNTITIDDPTVATVDAPSGIADDLDRTGSDISISLWFQAAAWDSNWQTVIAHGEDQDYRIARRGSSNPVQFVSAVGTTDMRTTSTFAAGDGLWHHIVITGVNGGSASIYVNGALEATSVGLGDPTVSIAASTGDAPANLNLLMIGGNPDAANREFNGLIDDVGMWDRALTAQEVSTIYTAGASGTALSALLNPDDLDGDGLPNFWEAALGVGAEDDDGSTNPNFGAAGDPDVDGSSNLQEFTNGTDPMDSDSDDDTLLDGVETYLKGGVLDPAVSRWVDATDTGTNPLSKDTDGDGLDDNEENNSGTFASATMTGSDPTLVNSDADDMPDGYEVDNLLDPTTDDSADDADGDLLLNGEEFLAGTDPQNTDSDSDFLDDKVETNTGIWESSTDTGTDPLNPDSDSDTLLDGYENNTTNFVSATETGTNPHLQDTDADGFNDDAEITLGTDPTDGSDSPVASNLPIIDDFEDNNLDVTTWRSITGTISQNAAGTLTGGTISEEGGDLVIGSRGYLVTTSQFDPELVGGIEVSGELTFLSGADVFTVLTRSDATPLARYGEANSGVKFSMSILDDEVLIQARNGDHTVENVVVEGDIDFLVNTPYLFTVVDDGMGSLSMVVSEKDVPANTISITADLTSDFSGSNFVVIHNREGARTSSLQEISITSAASSNGPPEITEISFDPSDGASGTFSLTWTSSLNASYALSYSTDLMNWDEIVANNITGLDGTTTEVFPNPEPGESRLFFRIEPSRQ